MNLVLPVIDILLVHFQSIHNYPTNHSHFLPSQSVEPQSKEGAIALPVGRVGSVLQDR